MCFNLNKGHYLNGLKIQWALNCIFCRVLEEPFGFVNAGGGGEHLSKEKQRSNLSIVILSSRELLCSCWNTTFYYWDYVQEKQNYIFRESFYFFFSYSSCCLLNWTTLLFLPSFISALNLLQNMGKTKKWKNLKTPEIQYPSLEAAHHPE